MAGDPRARLPRRLLSIEVAGGTVAGGTTRAGVRALRDGTGPTEPDGLGTLRQLGRAAAVLLRIDLVLFAHALHRVHAAAGREPPAALSGSCVSLFRRSDGKHSHRPNEDGAAGPAGRRTAFQPRVSGLCRLLRLRTES